jgi:ABC-type transport system involved in multi-copper enzyme maturation permease subunit
MILTELKRILKEGIIIILILAALPVYILTTSNKDPYFAFFLFLLFLLIYASFTGWSMFDRERQDGAEEYLFSMPASRTRIFFLKFLPRLLIVLFVLGCFHLVNNFFDFPTYYPVVEFSIFYISFFLISLSFSISIKNFIGALFLTSFMSIGLTYTIRTLGRGVGDFSAVLIANLALFAFPIAFFVAFQTLDIKPVKNFNLKFVPPLLIVIGLVVGFFWFQGRTQTWGHYYLARKGDVFRSFCTRSQWIRAGEPMVFNGCLTPLYEENNRVYLQLRERMENGKECMTVKLEELNLLNGNREKLLDVEDGWALGMGVGGRNGVALNGVYYNILRNLNRKQYKIIAVNTGPVKETIAGEIPVYGNFYEETIDDLFHVGGHPLQFFVTTQKLVYRIFENGEAEELFPIPEGLMVWKDRILILDEKGMTLYDIREKLTPVFHKDGTVKKVRRKFGSVVSAVMLIQLGKDIYLFDMENPRLKKLGIKYRPYYYHYDTASGVLNLLWVKGDELIFSRMEKDTIKKKRTWTITIPDEGWRIIRPFPSGVLVYNSEDYERFLFDQ